MNLWHLTLKTQKVQSFIFKVPILRYMIGANSALGEFFAEDLPIIKKDYNLTEKIKNIIEKEISENSLSKEENLFEYDNIFENFKKGIFSSAGGHFEAVFDSKNSAEAFTKDAFKKASEKLPGVKLSYSLELIDLSPSSYPKKEDLELTQETFIIDNPFYELCSKDGENPKRENTNPINTSSNKKNSNEEEEEKAEYKYISDDFIKILSQRDAFQKEKSNDYLIKFYDSLGLETDKFKYITKLKDIADLNKVSEEKLKQSTRKNNFYCLIAMDGNGMGKRFNKKRDEIKEITSDPIKTFIETEKFWFESRNSVRKAMKKTLERLKTHKNYGKYENTPFFILMMGGDDILLAIMPDLAFEFVNQFTQNISSREQGISFSIGMAFVNFNHPFAQAHQLAEECLDSAKILSKLNIQSDGYIPAAIDWHVSFDSYYRSLSEIRKEDYCFQYQGNFENEKKELIDIFTKRPFLLEKITGENKYIVFNHFYDNLMEIINTKENDGENKTGINKFKTYRSVLKQGLDLANIYGKHFFSNSNSNLEFLYEICSSNISKKHIRINNALDYLELIDFLKEEGENNE